MTRALVSICALFVVMLTAWSALAGPRQTRTSLAPDTIEVGDTTALTFYVSPGDQASDPQITLPNGLTLVGKMIAPAFQISVVNGQMSQTMSARAIFRVRASHEGTFTLGAPSISLGGTRFTGDRVVLHVLAHGSLPRQQPDPLDPFGLFGGSNPFQGFDQQIQPIEPTYPVEQRFTLPAPRDSGIFLHATLDKTQAVVGEQITLSVWVYADVTESDPELSDPHEVGTSEFLRQPLLDPSATITRTGFGRAGTHTYAVALLRKWALFPLHAGQLEITPMRVRTGRGGDRESETLQVRVVEPPIEHRPAGYAIGDVGRFALHATVTPNEVERGAAVSVVVELSGWGNLPSALTVPVRPNVAWLDPEVRDDLKLLDEKTAGAPDVWGGSRTFSYVVTPKKEGDVDLGEIAVSFYDPRTRAYDVARTTLGMIHVKPGAAAAPVDDTKVLASMPPARSALAGPRASEAHLDDSRTFLGLLVMPTALFGIAVSARRAARRLAERAQERKTSPIAELKQRLRALAKAETTDDAREIDGAAIRVVESGALAHAGVNVRGVGGEAVADVLTRAGVDVDAATELRDLLEACAAARFSPEGVELADAKKRASRARAIVDRLGDRAKPSEPRPE